MEGQRPYYDPEVLSHYMDMYATNEHYFLISTRDVLVWRGWLYFDVLLQLNFQLVPKKIPNHAHVHYLHIFWTSCENFRHYQSEDPCFIVMTIYCPSLTYLDYRASNNTLKRKSTLWLSIWNPFLDPSLILHHSKGDVHIALGVIHNSKFQVYIYIQIGTRYGQKIVMVMKPTSKMVQHDTSLSWQKSYMVIKYLLLVKTHWKINQWKAQDFLFFKVGM